MKLEQHSLHNYVPEKFSHNKRRRQQREHIFTNISGVFDEEDDETRHNDFSKMKIRFLNKSADFDVCF